MIVSQPSFFAFTPKLLINGNDSYYFINLESFFYLEILCTVSQTVYDFLPCK